MEIMRPKPPSPIAGHPGANPAYEAWAHRHRLTRAAVYRTRTRGGGLDDRQGSPDDLWANAVAGEDTDPVAGHR